MLIVTEAAKSRIAQQLGPPTGSEQHAMRLIFLEDSFMTMPDRVHHQDTRFDHGGRTVLVVGPNIEKELDRSVLHVDPGDPSRLRLIPLRRRKGGQKKPRLVRQRKSVRSARASRDGTAGPSSPVRLRRVARPEATSGAIVERYRLTKPQMKVLRAVSSRGEMSVRELKRCSRVRRGSVERIAQGLERRGLLRLRREGRGGSGTIVRVTTGAEELLDQAGTGYRGEAPQDSGGRDRQDSVAYDDD